MVNRSLDDILACDSDIKIKQGTETDIDNRVTNSTLYSIPDLHHMNPIIQRPITGPIISNKVINSIKKLAFVCLNRIFAIWITNSAYLANPTITTSSSTKLSTKINHL